MSCSIGWKRNWTESRCLSGCHVSRNCWPPIPVGRNSEMRPLQENDVFHAIAHPARRRMLQALKAGERPAADLARPFGISFSAISQHLKILKDARLVTERREGRNRLYQLRTEPLQEIHTWAE